jgi:hypothetical protein
MFETGIPVADAAPFLLITYLLWGGWLVTGAGVMACLRLMRSPATRRRGVQLLIGAFAPFTHLAMWAVLSPMAAGWGDTGVFGLGALTTVHWLLVLAGPLAALRLARTSPVAPIFPASASAAPRPAGRRAAASANASAHRWMRRIP